MHTEKMHNILAILFQSVQMTFEMNEAWRNEDQSSKIEYPWSVYRPWSLYSLEVERTDAAFFSFLELKAGMA